MLENGNYLAMLNGMPEGTTAEICSVCGGDIYDGEEYYNIEGDIFCKDCLKDWADKKCEKGKDNCCFLYKRRENYWCKFCYCLFDEIVEFDDLEEWAEDFKVIAAVE